MKFYIQKKAGISFYGSSNMTMAVRKNYFEYVADFKNGLFGVINLIITPERLMFIADAGDLFLRLHTHHKKLGLKKEDTPLLVDLLEGKTEDFFIGDATKINNPVPVSRGILYCVPNMEYHTEPLIIAGKSENVNNALYLMGFAVKIYSEIIRSNNLNLRKLAQLYF